VAGARSSLYSAGDAFGMLISFLR
jgi:hypothetical protein